MQPEAEIIRIDSRVIAVVSIRINGKEADWQREEQQDPAETEPTGNADRNRDSHNVQERIVVDGSKKECYTNV